MGDRFISYGFFTAGKASEFGVTDGSWVLEICEILTIIKRTVSVKYIGNEIYNRYIRLSADLLS